MSVKPGSAWWILGAGAISTYGEEPKYPDAGPVIDLILTPSGTSVAMSWLPPNQMPGVVLPVGYVVKLEETGETVDVTDTNYIWNGLQIDTNYCFSVYSKSELGTLSAPVTDCVTTLKEVGADSAAQITHIGTSTFAISNPTRGIFEYYLSRSDTDFSQASLITDPTSFTVARNGDGNLTPYYVLTTYPGITDTSLMRKSAFVCTKVTYRMGPRESCTTTGGSCSAMCSGSGSPCGNCCCHGCGPVVSGGLCCCPGNTTCTTVYDVPIKNSPPSGYIERYAEWVKTDAGITREALRDGVVPFSSIGVWEYPYYISFETPERTIAQVEPDQFEDGTPNPDPKKELVFNYTIMLNFYNEDGLSYGLEFNSNENREHFKFVKEPNKNQEVDIVDIQGIQKGTWEMIWIAPSSDPHSSEDVVVLKQLEGTVI